MKNFQHKNLLVVGQSGSGKSNFIDRIIVSYLEENSPKDLRMILVDPKKVQFTQYGGVAHLISEIIHDSEKTKIALKWLLDESLRRLKKIEESSEESIYKFNKNKLAKSKLSEIVIVIEELADLMMTDKKFFEDYIRRITTLSEITGIYFIIATARPSSEYVLTGKIMSCFPNRICFRFIDENVSLHVLGEKGAENLSLPGSCLIKNESKIEIEKFQMPFASDEKIVKTINAIRENIKL